MKCKWNQINKKENKEINKMLEIEIVRKIAALAREIIFGSNVDDLLHLQSPTSSDSINPNIA